MDGWAVSWKVELVLVHDGTFSVIDVSRDKDM